MQFTNRDINLLAVHTTLHKFAWAGSGVFIGVYLYRAGIPLATIFLAFAAIYVARFILRPLVVMVAPVIGVRATLIFGTLLHAAQYPALALIHGVGFDFVLFCAITAIGWVFYWTCYHAVFSALGDADRRGSQVGARQVLGSVAAVLGPAVGGIVLTAFGPWAAFGAAAIVEAAAIAPLFWISDPYVERVAPKGVYAASMVGMQLFATDGWILGSSVMAWTIIMFQALDARFDELGGLLAVSAFAGAIGGAVLGRLIDLGHTRHAMWINASVIALILGAKSVCGTDPVLVSAVAIGAMLFGGLYTPTLMIALYNEAKASPCTLRFQVAAEGGWDAGALCACLASAGLLDAGAPLQTAIALAIPMVPVQAWLLRRSYSKRRPAAVTQSGAAFI
jgi:hypothetical protein